MPDNPTQQLLQQLVNSSLRVQWLSIKAEWEPALIQALAPMAGDCLAILRRELAANPDTPPDWPTLTARLAKDWATVARTRSNAAKALLLAMTKEVVEETTRILTLEGLAGPVPAPNAPGQDPRACQPAAKRWRWRLTMLARTLAHEVFNRARRAVCAQLP